MMVRIRLMLSSRMHPILRPPRRGWPEFPRATVPGPVWPGRLAKGDKVETRNFYKRYRQLIEKPMSNRGHVSSGWLISTHCWSNLQVGERHLNRGACLHLG